MAQPVITNFFQKRKRVNGSDIVSNAKVLILEQDEMSSKNKDSLGVGEARQLVYNSIITVEKAGISSKKIAASSNVVAVKTTPKTASKKATSKTGGSAKPKTKPNAENLPDIRAALVKKNVLFELKGSLSPKKLKFAQEQQSSATKPTKAEPPTNVQEPSSDSQKPIDDAPKEIKCLQPTEEVLKQVTSASKISAPKASSSKTDVTSTAMARKELGLMAPKKLGDANKELSLQDIKLRLSRSSKLAELRESLAKINKTQDKLKDIEQRKSQLAASVPKLGKFDTIAMEVRSPMKDVGSPVKTGSPMKSPTKGPAYQRYSSLAVAGIPALTLPYKHRCLLEVFRCVDTVVAMLHNRKETVTFNKLKPAVQQMLRRNFTESHLGQIKRVLPSAYAFEQCKLRSFGMAAKTERYELQVTPLIDEISLRADGKESEAPPLTPSALLHRRQRFADCLADRVKDEHDAFLSSLEPPLTIARDKLARWHPEFELEEVADVEPDALPQPPDTERYCTATDVLAAAKSLFSCNQRMENALKRVSELSMQNAGGETTQTPTPTPRTPTKSPAITTALKGIPKALLEKVRANQAARAMLVMSRSEAESRAGTQHSRLPELARIVRNLYVAEKKNVLPLEAALRKMSDSFREKLSDDVLEEHVRLMIEAVPGWLEIHVMRKAKYLKLSKAADMGKVMARLEALAAEKNLA